MASAVFASLETINKNQSYREQDILAALQLYGGLEYLGLGIGSYARSSQPTGKIALNIIRSCVDAAQAKIAKNNVNPMPLTNDGDWELQRKAKNLELFGRGAFYATKYHRTAPKVWRDAGLIGVGAMKITPQITERPEDSEIVAERTFPNELKVDDADAINGNPRTLYHEKAVARDVALALWPEYEDAIKAAEPIEQPFINVNVSDMIQVVEAWHLPTTKTSDDGKRFLGVAGKCFLDKHETAWTRRRFPFAFLSWSDPMLGFWGTGIAAELADIQYEINFLLQRIQEAFLLLGAPCIFVERSSEFPLEQLSNVVGNVYMYTGQPPIVAAFQTIHPEVFAHLNWLYQRAYEIVGISMLSAQSKKPSGLDSGEALRTYNDIETERFAIVARDYESHAVDAFELMVDAAKDIVEAHGTFEVRAHGKRYGRRFITQIDFAKIDLEEDQYTLQVFPVSSLPSEPAGRIAAISERIKLGLMTPDEAMAVLDLPDTEASNSLALAARFDLEEMFYNFFYADDDEVEYNPPEPFQNLQLGLKLGQLRYLQAKRAKVPEVRLELGRRWMTQAEKTLNPTLAPTGSGASMTMPPGGAPLAEAGLPPGPPVPMAQMPLPAA